MIDRYISNFGIRLVGIPVKIAPIFILIKTATCLKAYYDKIWCSSWMLLPGQLTHTNDSLPLIGRYIRPEDPQLQKSSLAQTTQFTTRMTTVASPDHYFITAPATARTQPTALD